MDASQKITTTGVVHGTTILLSANPGLSDGQHVQVVLMPRTEYKAGIEGLIRSAGALADDWTEEDDRILEQIYQDRKRSTRVLPP